MAQPSQQLETMIGNANSWHGFNPHDELTVEYLMRMHTHLIRSEAESLMLYSNANEVQYVEQYSVKMYQRWMDEQTNY